MDLKGKKIILASGSPRRRELLTNLGIEFQVDTKNNFKEEFKSETPHEEVPALMSAGKSHGFHRPLEDNEILITSDTMVLCGTDIMGKPSGRDDAYRMLRELSGRKHKVITAITIRDNQKEITESDVAEVNFKELTDEEIWWYIDNCKPFDKAGAYGIQEWIGYIGITGITGSYFTIMGFPTQLVWQLLQQFI